MLARWLQRRSGWGKPPGDESRGDLDRLVSTEGREPNDQLLAVQDLAGLVSFVFDVDSGHLKHSPGLASLFDIASCSTVHDLVELVHVEHKRAIEVFFCLLRSAPRDEPDEIEIRNAAGNRLISCRARVESPVNGQVWVAGVLQDVTDRREAEQHLRMERQRLADAQYVARMGTWEWIPETGLLELSEITCAITGRDFPAAISYDEYLARVFAEDREHVKQTWRELRHSSEKEFTCEHRYHCPNGLTRVLRIHGAQIGPVRAHGRRRLLGTIQDVTEQRAVATRLQRFTALCQVAPLGMGIFDHAARLVEANKALCQLLGYSQEQLREMDITDLTHPTESSTLIPTEEDHIARYVSTVSECTLMTRAGCPVRCELHRGLAVHDDGSRYWLLVFYDITERVRQADLLWYQATHDDLTGLPNRAAIKDMLATLSRNHQTTQQSLVFCDVDNFKMINDMFGHDTGDNVLHTLARRLRMHLPSVCTPARLSGDEFVVLCSDTNAVGGVDKLTATVSDLMCTTITKYGTEISVSASVGAAVANFTTTGDELLRMADAAMLQNKSQRKEQR